MSKILSYRQKLCLLLWKNFCILRTRPVQVTFLILSPALCFIILILLRILIDVETIPTATYDSISLDETWSELIKTLRIKSTALKSHSNFSESSFIPRLVIAFAPENYEAFNNIMTEAASRLDNTEIKAFENCGKLRETMSKEHYIAGVCFDEHPISRSSDRSKQHMHGIYPSKLNYSLIFPSELRHYDTIIGSDWNTNRLFDVNGKTENRLGLSKYSSREEYIREGFLSLQNAVVMAYLKLASNPDDMPEIRVQRFPLPPHDYDRLAENTVVSWSLCCLVGFVYPILYLAKDMVEEKEKRLKLLLNVMGVGNCVQFFAWLVQGTFFMGISSALLVILLMVHWNEGFAIVNKSSALPILFLLCSYNITSICFCFMICSFCSHTSTATVITGLLWLITYVPYIITTFGLEPTMSSQLAMSVFSNTVIGYAFDNIFFFEEYRRGLHWHNYFESHTVIEELPLGHCTVILYLLSVIYTCIGLYVERNAEGMPNVWKSMFAKRNSTNQSQNENKDLNEFATTGFYEFDPEDKQLRVEIKNLTKVYDGNAVVKNISMNLFENEIIVIMGHNGSGKTTLVSMIMGIVPPTYGVVLINAYNVQTQKEEAYFDMSVCLDNDVLFDDLSVADQLTLFSNLKGLKSEESHAEVEKYLKILNMQDKEYILTNTLTTGLRKHLAVCCALIGHSTLVVLDDPSTGMDLYTRRFIWEILEKEKRGRTILMTSHSTDEASVVGDRVAIISNGMLKCFGSISFVKQIIDHNYRLVCIAGDDCNIDDITEIVRKHAPYIEPESQVGNEIYYIFKEMPTALIKELEDNLTHLNLVGLSISVTSFNDAYLKLNAKSKNIPNTAKPIEVSRILNKHARLGYCQLVLSQWKAMMLKHFIFDTHCKVLMAVQILAPILIATISLLLMCALKEHKRISPMTYGLTQYTESITIMHARPNISGLPKKISENYKEIVSEMGLKHKLEHTGGQIFATYILEKHLNTPEVIFEDYLVGVDIGMSNIVAWFNNYPLHAAPLSLNLVHNAVVRALLNKHTNISVSYESLPYYNHRLNRYVQARIDSDNVLIINFIFYMSFIWTLPIIFLVRERQTRFKMLQFISGLRVFTFWLTSFTYCLLKIIITSFCAIIITIISHHSLSHSHYLEIYVLVFILSGYCTFPLNYLLSMLFRDPVSAYITVVVFNLLGGIYAWVFHEIVATDNYESFNFAASIDHVFGVMPHFTLYHVLSKLFNVLETDEICADENIRILSTELEKCKVKPNCCLQDDVYSWVVGELPKMMLLLTIGTASWILLCLIETRAAWRFYKCAFPISDEEKSSTLEYYRHRHADDAVRQIDDEVFREQVKLLIMRPKEFKQKTLVCEHVSKNYKNVKAVNSLYLVIERSECFGLLGVSGSGKSTVLHVLTGVEKMSYGRIHVRGVSLKENPFKVYDRIGYCPQDNAFLPEYTSCQLLRIHCLLRGVPQAEVARTCENMAKVLEFYQHYNKPISKCSSGNRRRLSLAISMLGNTSILYLDDITSGIDPTGRRVLWRIIGRLRAEGRSIMLTSLNPHELERLCGRIGVLSKGNLLSLYTTTDLLNKYTKGYVLRIRIRKFLLTRDDSSHGSLSSTGTRRQPLNPFLKLQTFIDFEFPGSVVLMQYENNMSVFIPFEAGTMSDIIRIVRENNFKLHIEQFLLRRQSFATFFLDLEEKQRNKHKLE